LIVVGTPVKLNVPNEEAYRIHYEEGQQAQEEILEINYID
jgi:hypothetical protein